MAILIGIVVVFMLMFILGVQRSIIVFIALSLMLLFTAFCVIFFIVSFINLLRSSKDSGCFGGFMYFDSEESTEEKHKNKVAFASYKIGDKQIRNLFPTDEFMLKLYKTDEEVPLRVCNIGRKSYAIDRVTMVIIFIGLPVFGIITVILIPLIMQYMYIFNV